MVGELRLQGRVTASCAVRPDPTPVSLHLALHPDAEIGGLGRFRRTVSLSVRLICIGLGGGEGLTLPSWPCGAALALVAPARACSG